MCLQVRQFFGAEAQELQTWEEAPGNQFGLTNALMRTSIHTP